MKTKKVFFLTIIFSVFLLFDSHTTEITAEITTFTGDLNSVTGPKNEVDLLYSFPKTYYKIHTIRNLGSFYIDNRIDIIKNVLRSGHIWEENIVRLIQRHAKPGTVAIDIGSHIGTHTLTMSKIVGDSGRVVAFEPQIKIYSELIMNMILNHCKNVTCYRCALGERFDTIEMDEPVVDNEGGTGIGTGGDKALMITLDSLQLQNVSLMKIDVENYELEVLKGAEKTILENHPVMIIEIMGNTYHPIDNRSKLIQDTLVYIESLGYTLAYIPNSWSDWLAIPKNHKIRNR